ncbi:hypothetical protein ACHWQZ_G015586 [Mnemiopsis leidyi]
MLLVYFILLVIGGARSEGVGRCETCSEFRLHDDYCAPRAVVLGHVRVKGWFDDQYDFYNIHVTQIFRRSFKIKMGMVRVLTPRPCGKKLQTGELYILGLDLDKEAAIESLKISRCALALEYKEVPTAVRNAIVRRRIDCTCGEASCGVSTCNAALQSSLNSLQNVEARTSCLYSTAFCNRYTATGDCCWTLDFEKVSRCYVENLTPEQTDIPPIGIPQDIL